MKNEELVKQLTSPSKNSRLEKFGKTITFSTGHQVGNYTDGGCCRRGASVQPSELPNRLFRQTFQRPAV